MRKPRWALSGAHGAALLEAFAAEDWAALCGTKRDGGLLSALRAGRHCFGLRESRARRTLTLGLAILTALGFVLKVFVVEEVLFSRCKYEVCSAINTLKNAILKLRHGNWSPL